MRFAVRVDVVHRPGVADPQGATVERSLPMLGIENVHGVTIGKVIRFVIDSPDADMATREVESLCRRFLTNPVIEDATIEVTEVVGAR